MSAKNHKKNINNRKMSRSMPILAICSSTKSQESTGKRGFQTWTDRQTYKVTDIAFYRLNGPRGQFSENTKYKLNHCIWLRFINKQKILVDAFERPGHLFVLLCLWGGSQLGPIFWIHIDPVTMVIN